MYNCIMGNSKFNVYITEVEQAIQAMEWCSDHFRPEAYSINLTSLKAPYSFEFTNEEDFIMFSLRWR